MFETHEERRARRDAEEREAHRAWRRRWRTRSALSLGAVAIGVAILAVIFGAQALVAHFLLVAQRAELEGQLTELVRAAREHHEAHGAFPTVGNPVAGYEAAAARRPYVPSGAISLRPDGLRGAYWMIGSGDTFEAHAMLDADGDGIAAHWIATESSPPRPLTDDGVY